MHIKEKRKNRPTNRTIRCCRDLIYRSSANERDTRAIYEIVLSMRIHFDCKILENYFRRSFFLVNGYCSTSDFHSDLGVHLWKIPLEREFYSQMYLHSRVIHIYSRSNFLYEKILRTTCEERLKRKSDRKRQVPFPIALHFFFFFPLFSPSSLPFLSLFFFLIRCCVYSNIKRERFYASTPPFPLPPLSETHRTKIIEMKRR